MILKTVLAAIFLIFAGCSTMEVDSDYNPKYDFSRLHTFSVIYPEKDGVSTLTQERIASALVEAMQKKGYVRTDRKDADFYLLFHTDVTEKRQVVTDYQRVGLYPYYGYGPYAPMVVPVQREYEYTEGKIIVDALDPRGNKIFWRGIATDELRSLKTPRERIEYIRKVVDRVLESFPAAKTAAAGK